MPGSGRPRLPERAGLVRERTTPRVFTVGLRIADVDVRVTCDWPAFELAPVLRRTRAHLTGDGALELALEAGEAPGVQLVDALESAHVRGTRTPEGFWFHRLSGTMFASPDFSRCRVWRPRGYARRPPPFTGRPWLMFALWGHLAQRGGAFLHGAVCALHGRHVLLLADSQVGKSTLSRLVVEAGHTALTDEYPVVARVGERVRAHALPWPGRKGAPAPYSGDLAAIFFLRQAPVNELRQLDSADAGRRLVGNIRFFGWDPGTTLPTLETLDVVARVVPSYELGFTPTVDAVKTLESVL